LFDRRHPGTEQGKEQANSQTPPAALTSVLPDDLDRVVHRGAALALRLVETAARRNFRAMGATGGCAGGENRNLDLAAQVRARQSGTNVERPIVIIGVGELGVRQPGGHIKNKRGHGGAAA
ncbi:MAG TPA: hypothetical protein DCF62_08990, partial [Porticoccaceae bacterium]|nr:hypothetical protein [Porticoccaceae bacterium]